MISESARRTHTHTHAFLLSYPPPPPLPPSLPAGRRPSCSGRRCQRRPRTVGAAGLGQPSHQHHPSLGSSLPPSSPSSLLLLLLLLLLQGATCCRRRAATTSCRNNNKRRTRNWKREVCKPYSAPAPAPAPAAPATTRTAAREPRSAASTHLWCSFRLLSPSSSSSSSSSYSFSVFLGFDWGTASVKGGREGGKGGGGRGAC